MNLINHVLKEKSLCVFRIFMPEKLNNFKYALFQNIFAGVCVCTLLLLSLGKQSEEIEQVKPQKNAVIYELSAQQLG